MATADDVEIELLNNQDAFPVNGGHPTAAFNTGSLRAALKTFISDWTRFLKIDTGKPSADRTVPYGLRDSVSRIMFQVDENNAILRRLAKQANVDISDLP